MTEVGFSIYYIDGVPLNTSYENEIQQQYFMYSIMRNLNTISLPLSSTPVFVTCLISSTVESISILVLEHITTFSPFLHSRMAVSLPMPLPLPVTIALLFIKFQS